MAPRQYCVFGFLLFIVGLGIADLCFADPPVAPDVNSAIDYHLMMQALPWMAKGFGALFAALLALGGIIVKMVLSKFENGTASLAKGLAAISEEVKENRKNFEEKLDKATESINHRIGTQRLEDKANCTSCSNGHKELHEEHLQSHHVVDKRLDDIQNNCCGRNGL